MSTPLPAPNITDITPEATARLVNSYRAGRSLKAMERDFRAEPLECTGGRTITPGREAISRHLERLGVAIRPAYEPVGPQERDVPVQALVEAAREVLPSERLARKWAAFAALIIGWPPADVAPVVGCSEGRLAGEWMAERQRQIGGHCEGYTDLTRRIVTRARADHKGAWK